jgi:hypothetical protein
MPAYKLVMLRADQTAEDSLVYGNWRSNNSRGSPDSVSAVRAWHMIKKAASVLETRMAKVGGASSSTAKSLLAIVVIVEIFASKLQTSTANIYSLGHVLMI